MNEDTAAERCRSGSNGRRHENSRCEGGADGTRYDGLCAECGRYADLRYCEEMIALIEHDLAIADKLRDAGLIERWRRAQTSLRRQRNELMINTQSSFSLNTAG